MNGALVNTRNNYWCNIGESFWVVSGADYEMHPLTLRAQVAPDCNNHFKQASLVMGYWETKKIILHITALDFVRARRT